MIFKKHTIFLKAITHWQCYKNCVQFHIFVSVEQGDIKFFWFSIYEKVILGITAATKSCYLKNKKVKSRAKIVEICCKVFKKITIFTLFPILVGLASACTWRGVVSSNQYFFDVWLFLFSCQMPSYLSRKLETIQKIQVFWTDTPRRLLPPKIPHIAIYLPYLRWSCCSYRLSEKQT